MSDESLRRAGRAELDRLRAGSKKPAAKPAKRPRYNSASVVGIGKKKEPMHRGKSVDEVLREVINR